MASAASMSSRQSAMGGYAARRGRIFRSKTARDCRTSGQLLRAIAELEPEQPWIFAAYIKDKRLLEASNEFVRSSGRFDLTARGKLNTYALFAELFARLPARGRGGIIVPTGIATDATTAPFFAALIDGKRLATLFDFENRERIFPAIDSRIQTLPAHHWTGGEESGFRFTYNRRPTH